jgi:DNA repair photolyase
VKTNAAELLRRELAAPRWQGDHVAMGTNVDCYQRAEGRYQLMPGILAALRDRGNPFSILTKGSLILRDLELVRQAARVTDVSIALSVGFLDGELWRSVEPGTPSPQTRLAVCRTLSENGIQSGVLMAPVLPFLSDSPEQLRATVKAISQAGATSITPLVLHLRPGAREWYMAWLARNHPHLVRRYETMYAGGSYAPKWYQRQITRQVHEFAAEFGCGPGGRGMSRRLAAPDEREEPEAPEGSAPLSAPADTQLTLM